MVVTFVMDISSMRGLGVLSILLEACVCLFFWMNQMNFTETKKNTDT